MNMGNFTDHRILLKSVTTRSPNFQLYYTKVLLINDEKPRQSNRRMKRKEKHNRHEQQSNSDWLSIEEHGELVSRSITYVRHAPETARSSAEAASTEGASARSDTLSPRTDACRKPLLTMPTVQEAKRSWSSRLLQASIVFPPSLSRLQTTREWNFLRDRIRNWRVNGERTSSDFCPLPVSYGILKNSRGKLKKGKQFFLKRIQFYNSVTRNRSHTSSSKSFNYEPLLPKTFAWNIKETPITDLFLNPS